jgi:hypothetical protein
MPAVIEPRYDDAERVELRRLLQAAYGPGPDWAGRAARALGVGRQQIYKLASGRQRLKRRHWLAIERALQASDERLDHRELVEIGRVRRKFEEARIASAEARRMMTLATFRRPAEPI